MTDVLAVAIFTVAYIFIATERVSRVAAALGGAAGMVLIGVVDAESAFFAEDTAIDWNVIFLLLGMMIIVSVLKQTGIFDYLAIWAAKRARGRPFAVMVLLVLITAFASALLDNVTTVLLIAPVTFLVCARLGVNPVPFLIAEVLASNIGGTATLIGDPPNIIIASRAGLTFNDFLLNLGPIVLLLIVVFVVMCRFLFRSAFAYDEQRVAAVMSLDERELIRDRGLLIRSGVVLALVLVGFVLHPALGLEPSIIALLGAGLLVAVSGLDADEYLEEVEWRTLVFFMGLFIMVGGLVEAGVIDELGERLTELVGDQYFFAASVLLWGSAVLSAIVDNIPYVTSVAPLVEGLVEQGGGDPQADALWWALALGADLGGNATAVGASANVVITRDRRPQRASDLVLDLHPVRPGGRVRHGSHLVAVPVVALLRVWIDHEPAARVGTVRPGSPRARQQEEPSMALPNSQPFESASPAPEPSIGQLVQDLSANVSTLVRGEIALAKADLSASAKAGGKGIGFFIGAAVLAVMAWLLISFCLVYALSETGLPLWACFLIVAAFYLIVAGIVAFLGKKQFDKFKTEQRSMVVAKETIEVIKTRNPV